MKRPKINSQYNYQPGKGRYVTITEPSETIPGESMTIQEIFERFGQGIDPESSKIPYVDAEGAEFINQYYRRGALDLTDLDELREHNRQMTEILRQAVTAKQEEEKAKAEEARIKAEERQAKIDKLIDEGKLDAE